MYIPQQKLFFIAQLPINLLISDPTWEGCHQTLFSCLLFSPFQPNFFTFLADRSFFLLFILLCFITLMTINKEYNKICNGTSICLLLKLAVRPPTGLLINHVPETICLFHQVLCWYLFCCPFCFPSLKVRTS